METIVTSTIFSLTVPGEYSEDYTYSRYGNPTRDLLEASIATLDKAQFAKTYASKAAAALALMSSLKPDDRVIFINCASGTKFKELCVHLNMDFLETFDADALKLACKSDVKMVWMETPTLPLLNVVDIKEVAEIVRSYAGNAILVVENTLLTSHFQKPLDLGADAVIYSMGEFFSGHCDVNMGAVTTNSEKLHETLKYQQYASGAVPSPFDCFLVLRSLKTLSLRMEKYSATACKIASFLQDHQKVDEVFHPSLLSQKNHEIATKQSSGHPGIVTFRIKQHPHSAANILKSLKVFGFAEALVGGTESTAFLQDFSNHGETNVITLSIGLENFEILIKDLDQALSIL